MCVAWLQVLSRQAASSGVIKGEESATTWKPPFTWAQPPSHPTSCLWASLPEAPMVSGPFQEAYRGRMHCSWEPSSWAEGATTSKSCQLFCLSPPLQSSRGWQRTGLGSSHLPVWLLGPQWPQTLAQKPGATCEDRLFLELVKSAGQLMCCNGFCGQLDPTLAVYLDASA